jgi:hypothetical protein
VKWALAGARLFLGALFVYAAATKLQNLAAFAEEVANYRLVPAALAPTLAAVLPGLELLTGLLLCVNRWVRAAACVASAMLVVFIVALCLTLLRGIDLRCGCFGGSELVTWRDVARDGLLLTISASVFWKGGRPPT